MKRFVLFLVCSVLLIGCKSVQTVHKADLRDSVAVQYRYDTTHITITDTLRVEIIKDSEKEQQTEIVFGDGGGSYNASTGQTENVKSVRQSNKEKELAKTVSRLTETVTEQSVRIDSLQQVLKAYKIMTDTKQNTADIKPKRSGWDKFCTWCVIISWALMLLYAVWWAFKKFYLHR